MEMGMGRDVHSTKPIGSRDGATRDFDGGSTEDAGDVCFWGGAARLQLKARIEHRCSFFICSSIHEYFFGRQSFCRLVAADSVSYFHYRNERHTKQQDNMNDAYCQVGKCC